MMPKYLTHTYKFWDKWVTFMAHYFEFMCGWTSKFRWEGNIIALCQQWIFWLQSVHDLLVWWSWRGERVCK